MSKPQPIKFPPKTTGNFKERTLAVAYVTALAGGYVLPNGVAALIEQDLGKLGFVTERPHITSSMRWLARNGYALEVINGRRTQEFILAPDVTVPTPQFVLAQRARAAAGPSPTDDTPAWAAVNAAPGAPLNGSQAARVARGRPPLPRQPQPTGPARLGELTQALKGWHADEAEACDTWIEQALAALDPEPHI